MPKNGKSTNGKTSLAVIKSDYAALAKMNSEIIATIKSNFATEEITPFDLIKLTVPPGGITSWQIPDDDAESGFNSTQVLQGIILDYRQIRSYWEESFEVGGGGQPPNCSSNDGVRGIGTVGGEPPGSLCAECPLNVWGSAPNDRRGKACKEMRLLMILQKNTIIPTLLSVPPTSLKNFKHYLMRLSSSSEPRAFNTVSTNFKIRQEDKPVLHGQIVFQRGNPLSPEEMIAVKSYCEAFQSLWQKTTVTDVVTE